MPSTIPYDPSLDVTDLVKKTQEVATQVQGAAVDYATAKMTAETAIQPLRAKIAAVSSEVESPIDYSKSILQAMPISSDSMELNVQYFSLDENVESSNTHASNIGGFVSAQVRYLGDQFATQASASAQNQVNNQLSKHSIAGTLVIVITATHKNAQIFSPLVLDMRKSVEAWNTLFSDELIDENDPKAIYDIQNTPPVKDAKHIGLLSGATYGSSFVGMVHILNQSNTQSYQAMSSIAESMQASFDIGGWFAHVSGGFGVASSFSNSVKSLLSTTNIQSHCSVHCMGIIPSIKSNEIRFGVKGFKDSDPGQEMQKLATLQGSTVDSQKTIAASADAARLGQQMVTLENAKITATLSSLSDVDQQVNKVLDINSLMVAMDDYINRCVSGGNNLGVPINYYVKKITKQDIARLWIEKYYPHAFDPVKTEQDGGNSGGGNN